MRAPTIARGGVAALVAVAAWLALAPRGDAAPGRTAPAGQQFMLMLDGVEVGALKSMTSKTITPAPTPEGSKPLAGKRAAALNGELELQFGLGMQAALFDWISASLKQESKPRSGAVVSFDYNGTATTQTEFSSAVLTELTIPALDAASKAAGFFTLKLAGNVHASAAPAAKASTLGVKQKAWTTANFQLEIDGLATKRVSKIDGLSIKTPASAAGAPLSERSPLKVTASVADIQSWQQWQQQMAAGQVDGQKEGRIVFLSADLKTTLAEIKLHRLGISALSTGGAANSGAAAKFDAELHYDSLELIVPAK